MPNHENPYRSPAATTPAVQGQSVILCLQISVGALLFASVFLTTTLILSLALFFLVLGVDHMEWLWIARVFGFVSALSSVAWYIRRTARDSSGTTFSIVVAGWSSLLLAALCILWCFGYRIIC